MIGVFSGLSCIDMSSRLCTVGCGVTVLAPMSKSIGESSVVAGFELNLSVSFSCVGVFFLRRIDGIRVRGLFVFLGKKVVKDVFRVCFGWLISFNYFC